MADVLNRCCLSDEAIVAIEYVVSQMHERIDFIITGRDTIGQRAAIIVELKQWSTATRSSLDNFVYVNVAHGHMEDHSHPSYQALNYANIIRNSYEIFSTEDISLWPCSYLHNMPPQYSELMKNEVIFPYITESPCFLKEDVDDFVEFIDSHVVDSDESLLINIDSSRVVTSRQLANMLLDSLHGNQIFSYDEGQATAVETIKATVKECLHYDDKRTIIIKGGAGTGKSVVALNVMGQLIQPNEGNSTGYRVVYCLVNKAPRMLYSQELIQGDFSKNQLKSFFKYPTFLKFSSINEIDCALFDEAHRLFDNKSGLHLRSDFHILDEAIRCSRVSVFFIDEDQMVTVHDFATIERIRETSERLHKRVIEGPTLELTSQFRVLGGESYTSFIKSFLGYNDSINRYIVNSNYDFRVFDTAQEMHDLIREKDEEERHYRSESENKAFEDVSGRCRVVAGYSFEWVSKGEDRDGDSFDIVLDDGNYQVKWNLDRNEYSWLNDPLSVNEVGCIHTCQGLDMNYCGVIIGDEFVYEDGEIHFKKEEMAGSDKTSGIRTADDDLANKLIRNTFNVLLTRGIKGTYVYCKNQELRDYLKSLIINP